MNDTLKIYIKEYSGDKQWSQFVSVYGIEPNEKLSDRVEILKVMGMKTKNLEKWLKMKTGGLGGLSATEVLEMNHEGVIAMREAIMRMPRYV